jgi:hypothetical protein
MKWVMEWRMIMSSEQEPKRPYNLLTDPIANLLSQLNALAVGALFLGVTFLFWLIIKAGPLQHYFQSPADTEDLGTVLGALLFAVTFAYLTGLGMEVKDTIGLSFIGLVASLLGFLILAVFFIQITLAFGWPGLLICALLISATLCGLFFLIHNRHQEKISSSQIPQQTQPGYRLVAELFNELNAPTPDPKLESLKELLLSPQHRANQIRKKAEIQEAKADYVDQVVRQIQKKAEAMGAWVPPEVIEAYVVTILFEGEQTDDRPDNLDDWL